MNRSTSLLTLGLVALVTLFAVTAQAQNLLTNGNFATGGLAPWMPFTTSNGTNGAGLPNVIMVNPTHGSTFAAHFNVGEVTNSGSEQGGGINQIFTVSTAGTYNFSASFGVVAPAMNAEAAIFSIVIDGTTVASKSLGSINPHHVLGGRLTGSVSLASGSHTFEVLITRMYTSDSETPNQVVTNIALALQ